MSWSRPGRPIRLAVHFSRPALEALASQPDLVDAIKVGPWTPVDAIDRLRERYALVAHSIGCVLSAPRLEPAVGWAQADELIQRTRTPWLSEHLGFADEQVTILWREGVVTVTSSDPLEQAEAQSRIVDNLRQLKTRYDLPILAENLDYVDNPAYRHVTEPRFIRSVVESAEVGLLLDLAHARVAADWQGRPIKDYLAELPLDRAVEWHLSSPRRRGVRLWDAHAPLIEVDYDLARWLIEQCPRLEMVTLEQEGPLVADQLRRLRELLAAQIDWPA